MSPFNIASADGKLQALRRGTYRLTPGDGGCVTVVVRTDGITVNNSSLFSDRPFHCSVGDTSLGIIQQRGGNDLARKVFNSENVGYAFPVIFRPGDAIVFSGLGAGGREVNASAAFYGGISPVGGSGSIPPSIVQSLYSEPRSFSLTVPPVPGD